MGDTLGLVGLVCVLAARNGANRERDARICADVDTERMGMEQRVASLLWVIPCLKCPPRWCAVTPSALSVS